MAGLNNPMTAEQDIFIATSQRERHFQPKPPLPELKMEATIKMDHALLEEAVRHYLRTHGMIATKIEFSRYEQQRDVDRYQAVAIVEVQPVQPKLTRGTETVGSSIDMREVGVGYRE